MLDIRIPFKENAKYNFLSCYIDYRLGNNSPYRPVKRGYYLSIVPVKGRCYFPQESICMLLKEVTRKSTKAEQEAERLAINGKLDFLISKFLDNNPELSLEDMTDINLMKR